MCVAWSMHLPAIRTETLIQSIDVLVRLLYETNVHDVELPGVTEVFEFFGEMIDD